MQERNLRRGPRRRSERLPAQILVQLTGTTETGQEFIENSAAIPLRILSAHRIPATHEEASVGGKPMEQPRTPEQMTRLR